MVASRESATMFTALLLAALGAPLPFPKAEPDPIKSLKDWREGKEYLGLTESAVLKRLGEPTSTAPGGCLYVGHEGSSAALVRVVRFKDGKVVSAGVVGRPIGCRYPVFRD